MAEAALRAPGGLYHDTCHHRSYFLNCEEFDDLWRFTQGCCQICGIGETRTKRGRLCIDHLQQHRSLVRGLLCDKCNCIMASVDRGSRNFPAARRYISQSWFTFRFLVIRGYYYDQERRRWGRRSAPTPGPEPANDSEE